MKMKKLLILVVGMVLLGVLMMPGLRPVADVAPPEEPFGGDVAPGDSTMVQMVAETVTIEVLEEEQQRADFDFYRPVADVRASFLMVNQGEEDEVLGVHFPLNLYLFNYEDFPVAEVSDFEVWVNGEQVAWERAELAHPLDETSDAIAWAVFEVGFAVGDEVGIEVRYQVPGVGYFPRTTFNYIFQTGGGWFDVIGEADLIVRLPYAANGLTIAYPELLPEGAVVEGNEMRWHFEDWEPTEEDNFAIQVMAPSMVESILAAEAAVLEEASFEHLDALNELFHQVLTYKGSFVDEAWGEGFLPAYEETLMMMHALEPENREVRAKFAAALVWHEELQGYGKLMDVELPVSMAFVDDVMFELKNATQDDLSEDEVLMFWGLDLYYYLHLGDDYEAYFADYEPKGVGMPAASEDALERVTHVLE